MFSLAVWAGYEATNCTNNVFIGLQAGRCNDGSSNILLGNLAGRGSSTVSNNTSDSNIASLGSVLDLQLPPGNYNIVFGSSAGKCCITTGTY